MRAPSVLLLDLDDTIVADAVTVEECWEVTCRGFEDRLGGLPAAELGGSWRGAIDLATVTGSVTIQTPLQTTHDLYIETESGDITLMVPPEASGVLKLKSESGTIKTELPVKIPLEIQ
jgi:hypothetical protein